MRSIKIVLVVLFLSFTGFAFAQDGAGQQPPGGAPTQGQPPAGGGMQQQSVEDEAKALVSELGLTADQQTKVLAILKEREEGVLKVRNDFPVAKPGSNPSQEGIAAMDKVMNGATAKIKAILNDEQKKKYETIKSAPEQGMPQK
jgi:periplasmic protein CpxP/Spy